MATVVGKLLRRDGSVWVAPVGTSPFVRPVDGPVTNAPAMFTNDDIALTLATDGSFSVNLVAGSYELRVPVSQECSFPLNRFLVTDDSNAHNLTALVTSPVQTATTTTVTPLGYVPGPVTLTAGQQLVLVSPDGTKKYAISLNNDGTLQQGDV